MNNNQFGQQNYEFEEQHVEKKKLDKGTIIFSIIFIVLLGLIGYLTFTRVMDRTNKNQGNTDTNNNVVENTQLNDNKDAEILDTNSGIVQTLFDYVDVDLVYTDWKKESNKTITSDSLSYSDKFKIVIDGLKSDTSIRCSRIANEIASSFRSDEDAEIMCGDSNRFDTLNLKTKNWTYDNNEQAFAIVYSESKIKQRMNIIFGGNYYTRKEVIEDGAKEYHYIDSINGYVVLDVPKGGTREIVKENLVSAQKSSDAIILFVSAASNANSTNKYSYKYTFKYDSKSSSYYFDSLEIKDAK